MSYTMRLVHNGETCTTDQHTEGAVYCLGGTNACEMTITGNYSRVYPIRSFAGQSGAESAPAMIAASVDLGTDTDDDYWKPTPGNVGYTLSVLGAWAMEHPDAVWEISG